MFQGCCLNSSGLFPINLRTVVTIHSFISGGPSKSAYLHHYQLQQAAQSKDMNFLVFIALFGTLAQAWRWPWQKPDSKLNFTRHEFLILIIAPASSSAAPRVYSEKKLPRIKLFHAKLTVSSFLL